MRWLRAKYGMKVARRVLRFLPLVALLLVASAVNGRTAPAAIAATTLNGDWAPFSRCPVDDPTMLAVDGRNTTSFCMAADSPSGSIKLGNTTATTGDSNVQFGLIKAGTTMTIVSPPGGAVVADGVAVPGGLLGLMCPSGDPVVASVCSLITSNYLNTVTASVQSAGVPSNLRFDALFTGAPLLTLPIKIQLQNPLLGSSCYIGSDANPIVLRPVITGTAGAVLSGSNFDADGTPDRSGPLALSTLTGLTEGDSTFAVPAASGCGVGGVLDGAINSRSGLPSPTGNNHVVLDKSSVISANLVSPQMLYPNAGKQLSDDWHLACTNCSSSSPTQGITVGLSVQFPDVRLPQIVIR